jgi:predicted negative regulator of RcsB-dependent stress response
MTRNDKLGIAALVVFIIAVTTLFTYTDWQKDQQIEKNKALIAANVALTKKLNAEKADAFKMGLITCENEDIATFNDLALEYEGTALGQMFESMANNWAYDDETMQSMIEEFMNGSLTY